MSKRTVSGITLTLLLIGMLALAFDIQPVKAEPTTIIVPDDYPTIQEAINHADEGDTIFVYNGTYSEPQVTIDKPLQLIGENKSTTIIDGGGSWVCVYVDFTHNVNISGFTIQNGYGIHSYRSENVTISGNIISNNGQGIVILESTNNTVSKNIVTLNGAMSIFLSGSKGNKICGNIVTLNSGDAIWLDNSHWNIINGNNVSRNGLGTALGYHVYGIRLSYSKNNSIYHNCIIDNYEQASGWRSVNNTWDDGYPSGGNYWSDYAGVDTNGDGIGDAPYVIDADNQDNYPLMYPWSPLPVHNINTGSGYATIQEAINAPETLDGHAIFVDIGTYYENVVVNKTVSLIGENPTTTIIDGGETGSVGEMRNVICLLRANNIRIGGFTIRNSGEEEWSTGVCVISSSGNNISFNIVTNNGIGILVYDNSSKNTLTNNIVNANRYWGIHLWETSNDTLTNNTVLNNYGGISIESCSNTILRNNTASGNMYNFGVGGVELSHFVHDIDTSNKVEGKSIQYLVNRKDMVIDSSWDVGHLCLVNSTNVTVKGLTLIGNWYGIKFAYTKNSRIENITSSKTTIDFSYSSNNTIINNNKMGIRLHHSNSNAIINNNISNARIAVFFAYSNNNTITNNYINNNRDGIWLHHSSDNKISGNNITANNEYGIMLRSSSNNAIYHNNFVDNSEQGYSYDSANVWDDGYPSGGNYWSDHVCTGNPSDGSQPYIIDANNIDHYPFQDPNGWLLHQLTVTSSPVTGIIFTINGTPQTTPYTEWLLEGSYTLIMPETHNGCVWSHWLEDGDPNRTKTVTLPSTTWTGVFVFAVQPYGPEAEFTWIPSIPKVGDFAIPIFDASASTSGWNGTHEMPITEYRWDFGDGNKIIRPIPIVQHIFGSSGNYYVTLTVYAPGATPGTDSITHNVTVTSAPVGGYSFPIEGYTTTKPLTLYLALIGILTASFTIAKRRKKQQS